MQVYFDFCLIFQTDKVIFQCENTSVEIDERVLDMIYNRIIPRDFELFPKSKLHKTFLIAKLIDERRDPSSFIFLKMRVEPSLKSKESQKYLLRAFPVICCDSSPNVGRMMSLIDHREKMWNIKPKIVHEEPKVEEVSVMKTSQIKHIISDEEKMFDLSTLELIFNKK
jgi:hypothetical protein